MDSVSPFENKVVLITGAARGIGRATAIEFAKNNAKVIAVSRTRDDLIKLQKQFPENIEIWDLDITSDEFIKKMESLERLDVCINNAGVNVDNLSLRMKDDEWNKVIHLNLSSTFFLTKRIILLK